MIVQIYPSIIDQSYRITARHNLFYQRLFIFLLIFLVGLPHLSSINAKNNPLIFDDAPLTEALSLPA